MRPNEEISQEKARAGYGAAPLAGRSPGAFVFSGIGPRITLAPEGGDGGGSGGGSDGGQGGGEGAGGDGAGDNGQGADGGDGGNEPPARPDYIPEDWWDAETGFKADDFNALVAFKAEHDANLAQVPDSADKYEVKLPQDFKLPEGFKLAEGQETFIDESDPRVAAAREYAHANKFSQAQFEGLIALGAQADIAEQTKLSEAVEEQRTQLGSKAQDRINAVTTWLGAKVGGELAAALTPLMYTAKSVQAFEALMRLNRGDVPGNPGAGRDAGRTEISDDEWAKMSPTQRINYAREHSKK
ncbi:hypothetical protein SJ05684_c30500 [Sinorhizobium sojae CCBAU 05684]|uniref:Uncharacterized protein n=1 Tax=Sinorhizobium sojae CCBAU 05684 TaxID=716928 RepID=A0A249PFM4_9HYPH|nr:hypothetical protein [Sinorhizobium sojae]ASY64474.1 hypothetical protein SJ05684_c30500 [Sinorhizobium sojae CCBAU 05684]